MEYLQHRKTYKLTPCLRNGQSFLHLQTNISSSPYIKHYSISILHFLHKNIMATTTEFVDYYAVLGLPSTASIDEIRRTVREKIDFLLDTDSESSAVCDQCILLREIEYVLCDEARRSKYDADYQVYMES